MTLTLVGSVALLNATETSIRTGNQRHGALRGDADFTGVFPASTHDEDSLRPIITELTGTATDFGAVSVATTAGIFFESLAGINAKRSLGVVKGHTLAGTADPSALLLRGVRTSAADEALWFVNSFRASNVDKTRRKADVTIERAQVSLDGINPGYSDDSDNKDGRFEHHDYGNGRESIFNCYGQEKHG